MILGMTTFVFVHVLLSLIGILTGVVVMLAMLGSKWAPAWTSIFLTTTILTSVTGFLLPAKTVMPSHIVGIVSLVLLAIALFALYSKRLSGASRWIYVVTAMLSLYLNVFVLVIQGFLKVPSLNALAPTQSEPPFVIAQGAVLVFFALMTALAARRFHPR